MRIRSLQLALPCVCALLAMPARAELFDRGGGLIYDSTLNITWLANALPGFGSAQDLSDGQPWGDMRWPDAVQFAANYSFADSVRHVTWDDWRLPKASPACGANAYNCTANEMGHLFYVDFKGTKGYAWTSPFSPGIDAAKVALFQNLQNAPYWNQEAVASDPVNLAYGFSSAGAQLVTTKISPNYILLVRDGDVTSPVPEPSHLALLSVGVLGLLWRQRRRQVDQA